MWVQRTILGALASALIGSAILVVTDPLNWMDRPREAPTRETMDMALPRIAVITGDQLEFISRSGAVDRQVQRPNLSDAFQRLMSQQNGDEDTPTNADDVASGIDFLLRSSADQLELQLIREVRSTNRVDVIESARVRDVLEAMTEIRREIAGSGGSLPAPSAPQRSAEASDAEAEALTTFEGVVRAFQALNPGRLQLSGQSDEEGARVDISSRVNQAGLAEAANQLGVDFILIADIQQPRAVLVSRERAYGGGVQSYLEMQPLYSYSLFQVGPDSNIVLAADARRPERPIRIPFAGTAASSNFQAIIANDEANLILFEAMAKVISRELIEVLAPARISTVDPLTIDRGEADGVQVGDEFVLEREATGNGASGRMRVREAVTEIIGKVRVDRLGDRIAYVSPVSSQMPDGASPRVGDLITTDIPELEARVFGVDDDFLETLRTSPQEREPAPALGARMQNRSAAEDQLPSLVLAAQAVVVTFDTCECEYFTRRSQLFTNALETAVREDNRVVPLTRNLRASDMERDFEASATGQLQLDGEGRTIGDFILQGEVNLAARELVERVRLAGRTRERVTGAEVTGTARLSIINPQTSEIIEVAEVDVRERFASLSEARSERAYREVSGTAAANLISSLMNRLFPPVVLSVNQQTGVFTIEGGRNVGFAVDQSVSVFTTGDAEESFYGPSAGDDRQRIYAGSAVIVDVQGTRSTARYDAASFTQAPRRGDLVELNP